MALVLARRNARMGRADGAGALRGGMMLAGLVLAIAVLTGTILEVRVLSAQVIFVAVFWVFYMALEPYVRRYWPELLIGWRALLAGRLRDPHVGRDVLAGLLAGVAVAANAHAGVLVMRLSGEEPLLSGAVGAPWGSLSLVTGGPEALAYALTSVFEALLFGLPWRSCSFCWRQASTAAVVPPSRCSR